MEDKNNRTAVYRRGVPTDPDIKMLREKWPESVLSPGSVIPYAEVEALLGCRRGSSRFNGVTTRWRRLIEQDAGILFKCIPGEGFAVLDNIGKLGVGIEKSNQAVRTAKRSVVILSRVDALALPREERARFDRTNMRNSAIITISQTKATITLPEI